MYLAIIFEHQIFEHVIFYLKRGSRINFTCSYR